MIRSTILLLAAASLAFAAEAERFRKNSERFSADAPSRQVIAIGGCAATGPRSRLLLTVSAPRSRVPSALYVTRIQVRYEDGFAETIYESDSAFSHELHRLKSPCLSEIILDGRSSSLGREHLVHAELD